jgi:malonate transporter
MSLTEALLVIFTTIGLGVFCQRRNVFTATQIEGFEVFLFKIIIPCYLFSATVNYDIATLLDTKYISSYLISFSIIALIIIIFYHKQDSLSKTCVRILASSYVNSAIYALPIITFLLGDPKAAILSNLVQVIIIQSIFITILSFIHHREKSVMQRLLISFSSPIVIMPILGLLCNQFQLQPPSFLTIVIKNLSDGVSGLALIAFGLSLGGVSINRKSITKDVMAIVFMKNLLHPILAFTIGRYAFNLDKYWLQALVVVTSAPTGFIIYIIAKQFSFNQDMAKTVVAISSIVSLISLGLIVLAFKVLA